MKRIGQRRVVKNSLNRVKRLSASIGVKSSTKSVSPNYRSTPGVIKPKAAYKLRNTAAVYGRLGKNGKKRFKSDLKRTIVKALENDPGILNEIFSEIREEQKKSRQLKISRMLQEDFDELDEVFRALA